jgi:RimJ/RimL family protein N-acetyltransferase
VVVGTVTLAEIDPEHRRAELGVMVRRVFWGEGYGSEAVALGLEYGFGALGLHRVEADIDPRNDGSIRLVTSLGFRREGLLRHRWRSGDEWQDAEMYGLLEDEWRARGDGSTKG